MVKPARPRISKISFTPTFEYALIISTDQYKKFLHKKRNIGIDIIKNLALRQSEPRNHNCTAHIATYHKKNLTKAVKNIKNIIFLQSWNFCEKDES